jgi:hypothetical protein
LLEDEQRVSLGELLVVLNDDFILPIIIQKGENYILLHTYTFIIDRIPLVLENYHFAGNTANYKRSYNKMAQFGKAQNSTSRKRIKGPTLDQTRAGPPCTRGPDCHTHF